MHLWMATSCVVPCTSSTVCQLASNLGIGQSRDWFTKGILRFPCDRMALTSANLFAFPVTKATRRKSQSNSREDTYLLGLHCRCIEGETLLICGQFEIDRIGN